MLDALVDFEFRVGFEGFPDGGFGVVTRAPGAVGEHILEQAPHHRCPGWVFKAGGMIPSSYRGLRNNRRPRS